MDRDSQRETGEGVFHPTGAIVTDRKWRLYESLKRKLLASNPTPEEYQAAIAKIARELGL
jgi:hypothetical protein